MIGPGGGDPSKFPALFIRDLTVAYDEKPVLWDIDLDIEDQSLTALIGPNGAGKSTLIKAVLNLVPKSAGTIRLFGESLEANQKSVAYVPQRSTVDWSFPTDVLDVVMMGTYGSLGWLRRPGKPERDWAMQCLERVGMQHLHKQQISELSGGQQQRVFVARALAQRARLLLLDEPFAGIDATTEETLFRIFKELVEEGRTVVVVHHDLATVVANFTHAVLLNVRVKAAGKVSDVFQSENLERTYGGSLKMWTGA